MMKDLTLPRKIDAMLFNRRFFRFPHYRHCSKQWYGPILQWNTAVDTEVANTMFEAGFNITALGLGVITRRDVDLSMEYVSRLHVASAIGSCAAEFLLGVVRWGATQNCKTWRTTIKSTAVAVCLDTSLIKTEKIRCAVETQGVLTLGQTVVNRGETFDWTNLPIIHAAYDMAAERFLYLLVNSICSRLLILRGL